MDTVGFVSRLPHHLVEAFKSTLEEAAFADVIIKVADAGDAQAAEQLAVTDEVLGSLDCESIPSWWSTTNAIWRTPLRLTRTFC